MGGAHAPAIWAVLLFWGPVPPLCTEWGLECWMAAKILIVDDSATVRLQLRSLFVGSGFEVVEGENGVEG